MRILYPYNEILPKRKAHDIFIFNECHAFAHAGARVDLLTGKGNTENLFCHYGLPALSSLRNHFLPILRKNNLLNVSWNLPFFFACQKKIAASCPDVVILSVLKQAAYHLSRKVKGVKYVYEVHELCYYPGLPSTKNFELEKRTLAKADLLVVTTYALKDILQSPPYQLSVPIEILPLAVRATPLPKKEKKEPFILMYVGGVYPLQGIDLLLEAMNHVEGVVLKIVGGSSKKPDSKAEFLGFVEPSKLKNVIQEADAFVAPFQNAERMPYVAHTKLYEYAKWGRPFIAPKLPIVQEHFPKGVLLFEPDDSKSLASCIESLKKDVLYKTLQDEMSIYRDRFTWEQRAERYREILM